MLMFQDACNDDTEAIPPAVDEPSITRSPPGKVEVVFDLETTGRGKISQA